MMKEAALYSKAFTQTDADLIFTAVSSSAHRRLGRLGGRWAASLAAPPLTPSLPSAPPKQVKPKGAKRISFDAFEAALEKASRVGRAGRSGALDRRPTAAQPTLNHRPQLLLQVAAKRKCTVAEVAAAIVATGGPKSSGTQAEVRGRERGAGRLRGGWCALHRPPAHPPAASLPPPTSPQLRAPELPVLRRQVKLACLLLGAAPLAGWLAGWPPCLRACLPPIRHRSSTRTDPLPIPCLPPSLPPHSLSTPPTWQDVDRARGRAD